MGTGSYKKLEYCKIACTSGTQIATSLVLRILQTGQGYNETSISSKRFAGYRKTLFFLQQFRYLGTAPQHKRVYVGSNLILTENSFNS